MLNLTNILAAGGVLAIFTGPAAVWALIGTYVRCSRLEQRNAAQAQTIAGLQARLNKRGGFEPWPRDAKAKLQAETAPSMALHLTPSGDGDYILCTDETCRTAIDPRWQSTVNAFHARRDYRPMELHPVGDVMPDFTTRHWAQGSPSTMIATTDATLLTAVDPAQQAELDRFHEVRDRFERESG